MHHGRQAVRDDDAGAIAHEACDRILDQTLALGIQRAGGLVEDEDARINQESTRDRDALALSARERLRSPIRVS